MSRRKRNYMQEAKALVEEHVTSRLYRNSWEHMCWNVKLHDACTVTFDKVFAEMGKHHYVCEADAMVQIPDRERLRREWDKNEDHTHERIIEDMQSTFVGKNRCDTARCCSPEVYKQFGVPADYDAMWDNTFAFLGRSSGWLSMQSFERVPITDAIWEPQACHDWWYQHLCCMIITVTEIVNGRNDEYLYQAGFQMQQLVEELWP